MSKLMDEIYEAVLPEMKSHGIEDTTENRLIFLTGVKEAWMEDADKSHEKMRYMMAISFEIIHLDEKIQFNL